MILVKGVYTLSVGDDEAAPTVIDELDDVEFTMTAPDTLLVLFKPFEEITIQ